MGRLVFSLRSVGMEWPEPLLFAKSMHALDLTTEQRMLVTHSVDLTGRPNDMHELRRVVVRLFDQESEQFGEELFREAHGSEDSDDLIPATEEAFELQKAMVVTPKNRGCNLEKSMKDPRAVYGGVAADSEESVCRRCKKPGHWWRDCPMPYGRNVIFPKPKAQTMDKGPNALQFGKGKPDGENRKREKENGNLTG